MPEISASDWDAFLATLPDAHLLQTSAWGELKSHFGWKPRRLLSMDASGQRRGAQILFRRLPLGFSLAYIPKGPLGDGMPSGGDGLLSSAAGFSLQRPLWLEVDRLCRRERAVFLKVEPDLWTPSDADGQPAFKPHGFRATPHDIQPARTILVDLRGDEDAVLARMKQKTRYNIRLALKKGVIVYPSANLEAFHALMAVTARRDGFGVHSLAYYRQAHELFACQGACELLFAEYDGRPLAALMVFARGKRAWYFYGASSDEHRDVMPSYLLQWEAMRWARAHDCQLYDLWGVPDADEAALEAGFTERSDGLWGVYRFKRGFGGQLRRSLGPWDRVYNWPLYWLAMRYLARRGAL
jgi:lipid II:glycine glycyltransferase (peptidoglycan interpeptide bridge formation enzyme)